MTTPQLDANGLPPLTDPGNGLISEVRCHLVIGKLPTPDGERGVATIRAGNATLTLVLGKAEAEDWAKVFAELARSLSGSALVIPQRGQAMQIAGQIRDGQRQG